MNRPSPSRFQLFFRRHVWLRNTIFCGACLFSLGAAMAALLQSDRVKAPASLAAPAPAPDAAFQEAVDEIDRLFLEHWAQEGLDTAPAAPPLKLLRRVSLALQGTGPSLEEIRHFEASPGDDSLPRWLDRVFADRRYNDYVAERLARAYVGAENGPFLVFRRRRFVTWLSEQLERNRPYNELVHELISDSGLWTDSPAVNFVTVTADQNEGNQPDETRLAARTVRAFLAVRLDCVQCHDDMLAGQWEQADFHQLAAFYAQAQSSLRGIRDNRKLNYVFKYHLAESEQPVPPKVPFNQHLLDGKGVLRKQLARWVTHPENKPFSRAMANRAWALLFGQPLWTPIDSIPLEEPLDDEIGDDPIAQRQARVERLRWRVLDRLADDFASHDFDVQRLFRLIAAARPFQLDSEADFEITLDHEQSHAVFPLTRLRPEQVAGAMLQAASLETINAQSHILTKLIRFLQENEFVKRYGDMGEDEFVDRGGTIPQRLLMMNGKLVKERTEHNPVLNASTRIALLAPDDETAVETAFLATLARRPCEEESKYFVAGLCDTSRGERLRAMEDLYWMLFNCTEFCWNH